LLLTRDCCNVDSKQMLTCDADVTCHKTCCHEQVGNFPFMHHPACHLVSHSDRITACEGKMAKHCLLPQKDGGAPSNCSLKAGVGSNATSGSVDLGSSFFSSASSSTNSLLDKAPDMKSDDTNRPEPSSSCSSSTANPQKAPPLFAACCSSSWMVSANFHRDASCDTRCLC